jgi:hypothetical protein
MLCIVLGTQVSGQKNPSADVRVQDADGLRQAVQQAKPGTRILIAPGTYRGSFYFSNLHGAPGKPIIITAANPKDPPQFLGAGECLHFSEVSHLELSDLVLKGASANGLNIDDGGSYETPSHHVTLSNLRVSDIGPKGNRDGIKLSGLDAFFVSNCVIERWGDGGSGIDMVGCHKGQIVNCTFRKGGADAVQAKGGSAEILVLGCRFEDYGERGINIGGSTGLEFFRPKLETLPADRKYEARDIRVIGNTFVGGVTPVAFVGVDGASVFRNTIYHPKRWALRILQETTAPGFVPSRNGKFKENIIVFRSDSWAEGGVNIGPGTAPKTFQFAGNVWYCEDRPERSKPTLPTPESDARIGQNPLFRNPARGDFTLSPDSPAAGRGADTTRRDVPRLEDRTPLLPGSRIDFP